MKYQSHLCLEEMDLPASSEWQIPSPCWCFVRLESGQAYWLAQGSAREISPGDVLVSPPSVSGLFRASQLNLVRLHYFRFCPELMSGLLTLAERQQFERLAGKGLQGVRLFARGQAVAAEFAELQGSAENETGFQKRCRMLSLIGTVFARELAPTGRPQATTLSATKRIKVLLEHLTEEEFLNASAEDLALYCGCSLRHFSRLFLQHFGVSLRSRQTEMRLLKARRLLVETDSRVMTVAGVCGYRHLGVFNGLFKKRFGMTPTEWRRESQSNSSSSTCLPPDTGAVSPASRPGRKLTSANGDVVTET